MGSSTDWGPCVSCKWWQIEPDGTLENTTMGQCIDEELQPFQLRVSGNSGCNRYVEGQPARRKGSSGQPPDAEPAR